MGIRGEVFSTRVQLKNRTYFFNVKENRLGDLYLNIVESRNKDEGGFERQSVVLFADDLQEFLKGFDESLKVMEKSVHEKKRKPRPERSERGDKTERGERPERGERTERGEKKSFRIAKRSEGGERSERGERTERGEYPERKFFGAKRNEGNGKPRKSSFDREGAPKRRVVVKKTKG
ncbi:hypothetical protein AGMMS50212_07490 [Spirochaetia bacterium]|nr:hypothetical protein AGMMS50212_07490 [Spirochaetia bacterium]